MKRGFTLVELLAVIVILAVISTIALPIVINTVNDSKKSTYRSSVDLYGKAVKQAVLNYELDKKVTPITFNQIKPYLEFEGNSVECETKIIYEDGEIYLKNCSVDGNLVEDYSYGKPTLSDTILKQAIENNYYFTTKTDFSKITVDSEYGLYVAKDDLGDSYYFRGDVENNYVQFGIWNQDVYEYTTIGYNGGTYTTYEDCMLPIEDGAPWTGCQKSSEPIIKIGDPMYWRIVRINGDGTIRLVYDGTELVENGIDHNSSIVKAFFSRSSTTGYTNNVNGDEINTIIKSHLESWYENNFEKNYGKYIADNIFCNDRSDENNNEYYDSYDRLVENNSPKLTCDRIEDKYTVNSSIGNGLLSKPIGLLTIDEAIMAGIVYGNSNPTYYLHSDRFWTMTPNKNLSTWTVGRDISYMDNNSTYSVRPVINLKADIRFMGTGTIDDPYVIMTD